jgi:PilZ domain-containing protein
MGRARARGLMHRKRRSGRIAKELDIVLLGTDTTGKVFSEETKTVVLSRHGAGVVSRYRFPPDELMTLRLSGSTKEAVVRLVGQIGGEPGRYVYGLAFVEPDPGFWPMEFPPPESFEPASLCLTLECSLCQSHQNVEQHEIEEDVYSVNGNMLRHCESCGTSTPWRKAQDQGEPAPARPPKKSFEPSFNWSPPRPAPRTAKPDFELPEPSFVATLESALAAARPPVVAAPATAAPASSYSAASVISDFPSMAEVQTSPAVASATAVLQAPEPVTAPPARPVAGPASEPQEAPARELDANGRPINKRRHVRIRVSFSACVRHPAHADEIVECENVSNGGVCSHSLEPYPLESLIELAAPFSPGETALFVSAKIKRFAVLSGGKVFRYGVAYVNSSSPARLS